MSSTHPTAYLAHGVQKLKRKKVDRLAAARAFYAKISAAAGGELQGDLERAFEFVPREYFLGPGPWHAVSLPSGVYVQTPTDDPVHVYQNLVFALNREKRINNGEPSLHGQLLGALHPARGNTVLHIGWGPVTTRPSWRNWSAPPAR